MPLYLSLSDTKLADLPGQRGRPYHQVVGSPSQLERRVQDWSTVAGILTDWGDADFLQLLDIVFRHFVRLFPAGNFPSDGDRDLLYKQVQDKFYGLEVLVIMPTGSVCTTAIMRNPGMVSRPNLTSVHVAVGWKTTPPDLTEAVKYFFVLREYILQVNHVAKATLRAAT